MRRAKLPDELQDALDWVTTQEDAQFLLEEYWRVYNQVSATTQPWETTAHDAAGEHATYLGLTMMGVPGLLPYAVSCIRAGREVPLELPVVDAPGVVEGVLPEPVYRIPALPPMRGVFARVVLGENEHAFNRLERLVTMMREQGATKHLLLVGPPSAGKTMTSQIVSRALERPFLPLSGATMGSDLFAVVDNQIASLHSNSPWKEVYQHPDNQQPVYRVAPTTVFVDEAHALPEKIQTQMLMATERPYIIADPKGRYVDFRDVLFVLGTTDPSVKAAGGGGLVKPLRTRCTEVPFVHYGAESVGEIVRRSYPHISQTDAVLLARAAKLYPRTALSYAEQAGKDNVRQFVKHFIGADEQGLDRTDLQILEALRGSVKEIPPMKRLAAEFILEQYNAGKSSVSVLQVANAKALLEAGDQYKPMGIQAIADRLMATDLEDVRARVHYMETLHLVERTPRGVIPK